MNLYLFYALIWGNNNSLLIHIEYGDIFYNDFNTKENFYNLLIAQQDETKQFIPKRISYHYSFEKYTQLSSIIFPRRN